MKLTVAVKLNPTIEQADSLRGTLERCNAACSSIAAKGFASRVFRQYDLHKLTYHETRSEFGLTAQAVVRSISKVADAFKRNREKAPVFRPLAAQSYDHNILRFCGNDIVSIWTISGREKIGFAAGQKQLDLLSFRKGEVDLCLIRGKWYLACCCDIPETESFNPIDWLGIDLGIVNIATDSDENVYSGDHVEHLRSRLERRRAGLQRRGTKAAKRRLRKLSGKQARFQKHTNHVISKAIVKTAERTKRGISLEDLKGIRTRVTAKRSQRSRLHNWSFAQLRTFIAYKAKRVGVPVVFVDPAYTSQECSRCGCIDKRNRPSQVAFSCVSCDLLDFADMNAARNIRARAKIATPKSSRAYAA